MLTLSRPGVSDDPVVLVTGFGPFPGVPDNPTALLARTVHGARVAGCRVVSEVLDVTFAGVRAAVPALLERHRPVAALHLGVAVRADRVRVETHAWNVARATRPDVAGHQAVGEALTAGAGRAARSDVDAAGLVAALQSAGHAARTSDDPGRYVCNATYWHSLNAAVDVPTLFVHVPQLDDAAWRALDLERVALIAVQWLAKAAATRNGPHESSAAVG